MTQYVKSIDRVGILECAQCTATIALKLNCHSLDNFESTTNTILCLIILHFRVMEIFVKHSLPSFAKLNRLLKALMTECQPQCTIHFPSERECLEIKAIRRLSCIDKTAKFVHKFIFTLSFSFQWRLQSTVKVLLFATLKYLKFYEEWLHWGLLTFLSKEMRELFAQSA